MGQTLASLSLRLELTGRLALQRRGRVGVRAGRHGLRQNWISGESNSLSWKYPVILDDGALYNEVRMLWFTEPMMLVGRERPGSVEAGQIAGAGLGLICLGSVL